MKQSLKSIICLMLFVALVGCAGHCFVEQAFAVSEHSAGHCDSHQSASDHEDSHQHSTNDHHHQSPCASAVSLLSQNTLFVSLLFVQTAALPVQPLLVSVSDNSFFHRAVDQHDVLHRRNFLSDLTLAPNAPPAST